MGFVEAFQQTMFRFKLSGVELAEKSGLSTAQVSSFKHGKNIRIDTLERILNALPLEAKIYLLNLVAQPDLPPLPALVQEDYGANSSPDLQGEHPTEASLN